MARSKRSLLEQSGLGNSGLGNSVTAAFAYATSRSDPRKRALRMRRRARRRASIFGATSGSTAVATATVAATSAPQWLVVGGSGTTLLFAVPAALSYVGYRKLRAMPLPEGRIAAMSLPPHSSAARDPMARLAGSRTSLNKLLALMSKSSTIAADDVAETGRIATATVESLTSLAGDIVTLERAADTSPRAAEQLTLSIESSVQELTEGVDQFDDMLAALAALTSPIGGSADRRRDDLLSATERLRGLAFALDQLRP